MVDGKLKTYRLHTSKQSRHLLGTHASLSGKVVNRADQYLRRLSQDPPLRDTARKTEESQSHGDIQR